ncbi:MAG: PilZ domain-containing protein [Phycisphaerae bacterium]|nr:PilZ domain-containing protein [Phycisphaerae bacterium]
MSFRCGSGHHEPVRHAVTRNVSTGGICFETEAAGLHIGDAIEAQLDLPAAPGIHSHGVHVRARAEIVRINRPCEEEQNAAAMNTPTVCVAARFITPIRLSF